MAAELPQKARVLTRQLTGFGDALGDQGAFVTSPFAHRQGGAGGAPDALPSDALPFEVRVGGVTDPGVAGKQNQDDFFLWQSADQRVVIAAVLDGHGRELGQLAAKVAKAALRDELTRPAVLAALRENPEPVLQAAFVHAHGAIEAAFTAHYEEQGWVVGKCADGFLTRCRAPPMGDGGGGAPRGYMCVHGGTTATVVVVLDGHRIVSANVGDSSALLCGLGADRVRLRPACEWEPLPPAAPAASPPTAAGGSGGAPSSPLACGGTESVSPYGSSSGASHHHERDAFPLGAAAVQPGSTSASAASASTGGTGSSSGSSSSSSFSGGGLASQLASSCSVSGGGGSGSAGGGLGGRGGPPYLRPLDRDFPLVDVPPHALSACVEVSADHSPESVDEYRRVHAFRPLGGGGAHHGQPELQFVYDTLTASKLSCPSIFALDPRTGAPAKTERGSYYKNVRCEWATLVSTPPHAPFQDALAFTRSLGDFHLQSWGVSHTPEVAWLDLCEAGGGGGGRGAGAGAGAGLDAEQQQQRPRQLAPLVPHPVALVVSSDGIWDNWLFPDVASFALTPASLADVALSNSGQGVAAELMGANLKRAQANFGDSADNMTGLVVYFLPKTS